MPRTRVHNMNVSLDGYAAGERVTFDATVGGAEIIGRRKFGPQVGDWPDDGWQGWWGDEPPFQTPVFDMSHHPHPTLEFSNGTSFRFVDGPPEEVLRLAQQAAGGRDVRIGGGPSTV